MDFLKEYGSSESSLTDNEDEISRDSPEGFSNGKIQLIMTKTFLDHGYFFECTKSLFLK